MVPRRSGCPPQSMFAERFQAARRIVEDLGQKGVEEDLSEVSVIVRRRVRSRKPWGLDRVGS